MKGHHVLGGLYRLRNTPGAHDLMYVRLAPGADKRAARLHKLASGITPSLVAGWDAHIGQLVVTEIARKSRAVHNVFPVADTLYGTGAGALTKTALHKMIELDDRLTLLTKPYGLVLALDGDQVSHRTVPLAYWFGWLYGYFESYQYVNPEVDHLVYSLRVKMGIIRKDNHLTQQHSRSMLRGYFKYQETYA